MTTEIKIDEKVSTGLKIPSLWKVVFLNDDVTPMHLVVDILMRVFRHSQKQAEEITLEIHNTGSAVVGIFSYEIAEQKGLEATHIARANKYPLKIQVEEE